MWNIRRVIFRKGEIEACLYDCGNNPGEKGKLVKQGRVGGSHVIRDREIVSHQLLRHPSLGP